MPAANAAALLRRNATDPSLSARPALLDGDRVWTYAEFVAESARWAQLLLSRRVEGRPFHVGVLLDNRPEYLFAFGGAALAGATVVGLNPTRQGTHLARDVDHTDVGFVVTEPRHLDLLPATDREVLVAGSSLDDALSACDAIDPGLDPDPGTTWALIFTSGTSDAPKAVICSQRRLLVTGVRMGLILELTPDDVGYICMPLFHSNALMVGWAPAVVYGASVGLAPRFSASGWLRDVRHYKSTWWNYTGKPLAYILATPETPLDTDNQLRVAYGNEGSQALVAEFGRRFAVDVIDAYGATEGGVAVDRDCEPRPGALGKTREGVIVVDEDGVGRPRAKFDADGRLLNAEECVGEIVNTTGPGPFEGYYNNAEATSRTTRNGWYWSGDLGYVDDDDYIYFAGRTAEWLRVDGENFPVGPIEQALARHPDALAAVVYGVPDESAGDQVMACVVLRAGASFDPSGYAKWLDAQPDLGPKWRPRYVRVTAAMPTTGTNKVVKRQLAREKWLTDDPLYVRDRSAPAYRPFSHDDACNLRDTLMANGRERFLDL
jgi:fatty-acyl-CoA synthase